MNPMVVLGLVFIWLIAVGIPLAQPELPETVRDLVLQRRAVMWRGVVA